MSSLRLRLDQFRQDFRYAVRTLLNSPGFSLVAVLTLALGIGATTTIFSVVNAMVLKPLPYEQPGQLVQVFEAPRPGAQNVVSPGVFLDWREQGTRFEGFAAYTGAAMNLTGVGDPIRVNGLKMSAIGLQLLRARPIRGRVFASDEDQLGKDKVVVLTYELWQRQFGGEGDIVGRAVALNDERYTVVGVLPAGFLPFEQPQFVVPFNFPADWRNKRDGHFLHVLARLLPGVALEQGNAELAAIAQRTKPLFPSWKRNWSAFAIPLNEQLVQGIKPALLVLLGAVGLVLLIACANVANLLLARGAGRAKEIALRAALGASRGRIVAQLLVESVVISLLGGLLGLVLAGWSTSALRRLIGSMGMSRSHEIAMDGTVLAAAAALALLTGIGFGLLPALQASRTELTPALKDAARGSDGGNRMRSGLIIAEVALSLVLLVGAGLLLHSFVRLMNVSTGFEPEHALTLQLSLADAKYPDNVRRRAFLERVVERVEALPGVRSAGFCGMLPLNGSSSDRFVRIPGWVDDKDPGFDADYDYCTPDYFKAMGIPLKRGRFFELRDVGGHPVAIINESFAQRIFPSENPIGRQLVYDSTSLEIVGVVGDVLLRGLAVPARQEVYRLEADDPWRNATLVVRTEGAPLAAAESVRKAILELDPIQPVGGVRAYTEVVAHSLGDRRLTAMLLILFAGAALGLAAIGLYGVIAYAVGQRTREFGIRMALGATQGEVLGMVLRRGLVLAGVGLLCGGVTAIGLTHLLGAFLYGVEPTDPVTFVTVSVLLLAVALLASWLPARRAARVDPMTALRCD